VSATEAEIEAARAMESLVRAVAAGYRNANETRIESALDLLRGRDDFKLMMMDLAMPVEPFGAALKGATRAPCRVRVPPPKTSRPTPTVTYIEAEQTRDFILAQRASVGSTEATSAQSASVSSDRHAYEAADQHLRAVFLILDLS
jgi:hypothetical protein